ncbi:MAG TPA: RNA-binding protein [Mucilaginibacter sp.]|nr:RNA-binding protein [Mucilaginibacter sp.]
MVKLFVSGFPLDIEEIELAKLFALHGDIVTIKLVRDKKTRICKGYGFIEMADEASAENAIAALDGQPMGDRNLTVKIRPDEPAAPAAPTRPVFRKPQRTFEPEKKKRPRRMM